MSCIFESGRKGFVGLTERLDGQFGYMILPSRRHVDWTAPKRLENIIKCRDISQTRLAYQQAQLYFVCLGPFCFKK